MKHKEIVDKVCEEFKYKFPNCEIEKEVQYKINLSRPGLNKQFFRVDVVVTDKRTNQQIGIECKTIEDSKDFRKLMAGIGQAYVLQKVFGKSYLAIEVESDMLPSENNFEFCKRYTLFVNIHPVSGIGILFVKNSVYIMEEAEYREPVAKTLFIRRGT